MADKSYFNWSGGKDSCLALYHILHDKNYSVDKLVTNVNKQYRRVSMHGVREELLEKQAASIGIPLQKFVLPDQPTMEEYEQEMMILLDQLHQEKFTHSIFGDIFLEDLRVYRESQLAKVNISPIFPLWEKNTSELIHEFIDLGFKTIVVCVKAELLEKSFVGRIIDKQFLKDLPPNVDPCGENGEFHTFVFDGPIFKSAVPFKVGDKVFREYKAPTDNKDQCFSKQQITPSSMGFWFCDLVPH